MIVNVVGCVLIGVAARRIERDTTAWAFVVTGVLGGFTTFSALAVELNDMADAERLPLAVLYGAVTLAAGVGGDGDRRRRSRSDVTPVLFVLAAGLGAVGRHLVGPVRVLVGGAAVDQLDRRRAARA